jgi:nickel transport protein
VIHQTDHLFVVETEDGHRARYSVAVAELGGVNHEESTPRFDSSVTTPVMAQAELSTCLPATLEPFMAQIVSKQLRPLREQLEVYQETVRWHDILGGIGYIFGIMGLWSYFAARRAAKNLPGL